MTLKIDRARFPNDYICEIMRSDGSKYKTTASDYLMRIQGYSDSEVRVMQAIY